MGVSCSKDTGVVDTQEQEQEQAITHNDSDSTEDFLPFSQLNDDVILCILSYLSYAPFERDVSGKMTLAVLNAPPRRRERATDETEFLVRDYNAGVSRLNKKTLKQKYIISPFRAPQSYYHEAFHGSATSSQNLSRINCPQMFGTLTHVLPLVNKRFHMLCNQLDVLWIESLERVLGVRNSQASSDAFSGVLWEYGMTCLINDMGNADNDVPPEECANSSDELPVVSQDERIRLLIAKACNSVSSCQEERHSQGSVAKEVFQQVYARKPIRMPIFAMFCRIGIGDELNIRLFEPRYRLLITEIMTGRSDREREGFPITAPRPRFLFACRSDGYRRAVVCIVEVRRCLIRRDGIADTTVVPTSWALLSSLSQRPQSGGLLDGTVERSPKRLQLPAFCMRTHLILGQPIRLRLFEERYKTLISEVMAGRSDDERDGGEISEPRPQFIFVCNNRFREGDVACLVDIERCRIHSDRSAQVTVIPTCRALVESIRKRPKSGQLYDASVLYPVASLAQD